jgi:hypothetical protein
MKSTLTLLFLCLTLACGGSERVETPPAAAKPAVALPTAAEAKAIIEQAAEFPDFQFTYASWSVPLKKEALNEATKKTVEELRGGGWLAYDGDGNVILTDKARNDKRFLVRSNDTLDVVPLAKKELLAVTAVEPKGEEVVAAFEWKWIPNEIGALLKSGLLAQQYAATHHARATLMQSEGKWIVQIIEEAP